MIESHVYSQMIHATLQEQKQSLVFQFGITLLWFTVSHWSGSHFYHLTSKRSVCERRRVVRYSFVYCIFKRNPMPWCVLQVVYAKDRQ